MKNRTEGQNYFYLQPSEDINVGNSHFLNNNNIKYSLIENEVIRNRNPLEGSL